MKMEELRGYQVHDGKTARGQFFCDT